ncbi:MAG: TldD/PmbA family protein [Nitrososphaerales archaeon]
MVGWSMVDDGLMMQDTGKKTVNLALTLGADEAESFLVDKEVITIRIADAQIMEAKGIREQGLALRIVKKKSIGAAGTSIFDEEHLAASAGDAISSASLMESKTEWRSLPKPSSVTPVEGCYDDRIGKLGMEECIDIARRMLDSAMQFKKVTSVSGSLHVVREDVYLGNSNAIDLQDRGTYIVGNINADARVAGSDAINGTVSGVGFRAARSLGSFDPESIGHDAGDMAARSTDAKKCEEGTYSVIFEPYALGELLSFVFAYNFNAKHYQDRRSCLYGKLGDKVAVDRFTLRDDPRARDCLGSKPFDDEGVPTSTMDLIRNGIFRGIIYDTFYAAKDNADSTGNASRAGYPVGRSAEPIPFPSVHNIVVGSGDHSRDEIIRDTKSGLLVGRLWYTYPVNPEKGDFSCTARSGIFAIKDGEIVEACRMVRIIDNLKRLLMSISAVGKERKHILQWHALPSVTPPLRVDGIRITPV